MKVIYLLRYANGSRICVGVKSHADNSDILIAISSTVCQKILKLQNMQETKAKL